MKSITLICSLMLSTSIFAGIACETNASSLKRVIEKKCSTQKGSERETCAKKEFDLVLPKVKSCKAELEATLSEFLSKGK
jgi:cellobiose-specific phosphotransferase system component IIB